MKIKKIDIKTELMEVKGDMPYLEVVVHDKVNFLMRSKESDEVMKATAIPFRKDTYEFVSVCNYEGQMEVFAVKIDERKLFTQLMEISQSKLDDTISKAVTDNDMFWRITVNNKVSEERRRIGKLPWWKRLFKQF